jgi:DDE superfamily endonuclease
VRPHVRSHQATGWAPKGVTPIVKLTAEGTVRVSVAGLCRYRPGERSRLIYRTLLYRGRKGEPKGFREPDFIRLLDAAHRQLQAPIVLVRDGLSAHQSPPIRAAFAARSWLRVYQLPSYAAELNPVEKIWSTMKRSLANHCVLHRHRPCSGGEEPAQPHAIPSRPDRRLLHRTGSTTADAYQTLTTKGV